MNVEQQNDDNNEIENDSKLEEITEPLDLDEDID
jgi:hypothetical protein